MLPPNFYAPQGHSPLSIGFLVCLESPYTYAAFIFVVLLDDDDALLWCNISFVFPGYSSIGRETHILEFLLFSRSKIKTFDAPVVRFSAFSEYCWTESY